MSNWSDILPALFRLRGMPAVLATQGQVKGSTPRESGAAMLVTMEKLYGTIGGGRLEHRAVQAARELIAEDGRRAMRITLPLGPELAQCCGGHAELLLSRFDEDDINQFNRLKNTDNEYLLLSRWEKEECRHQIVGRAELDAFLDGPLKTAAMRCLTAPSSALVETAADAFTLVQSLSDVEFHVALFGAGHVGRAVANALSPLPCHLYWIDSRSNEFPAHAPANAETMLKDNPLHALEDLPPCDFYLVMTHSHQLDLDISAALLKGAAPLDSYIGVIGSKTKNAKFLRRLARQGFSDETIGRLTCPIGLPSLYAKRPAEIAAGVAADLLIRWRTRQGVQPVIESERANAR